MTGAECQVYRLLNLYCYNLYCYNNSYIALYPVKIYKLAALYIININIRLAIKKSTITINAYINIKMEKKAKMKQKNY